MEDSIYSIVGNCAGSANVKVAICSDVNDVLPKDRDIAMVFQNYTLYPRMSVYDNMAFGLKLRNFPKSEIDARVREAAAMLGLEALLERKPKALSGGQRQRVAVGRAIVRRPKVFLFDEPLSNLDAKMRATTRTEISRLHARLGATMIYVTHDQVEAMTMGDRICVMKDGNIMQVAEPAALYRNPANLFVAGFIGSPPMNFFRGSITRNGAGEPVFVEENAAGVPLKIALDEGAAQRVARYMNRAIIMGIRPENVTDASDAGADAARFTCDARLELAEPMGAETFLHLTTGATTFIARVTEHRPHAPDQNVQVALDVSHLHFIDPETEAAIR